ncbi:Methyl-accepting chemotaxis sensory transducer with Pas/Pac sensor [Sulfitobacter noctilucicola]|uniref:Methyl-accepting chemotaxis protein n=1 Tax=Sulfitobacter noctilucicola TaxID=1342301 RepID=A0A7W6Q5D3_9RHOB|nr:PAS domain S-box protein [Sulfitobacter noctilucicola]KIN63318.1 Methyl-accepting chemotaxis sensory transducer with Pas/Pac sensor [Sulfitobacter noctilucicola]MBB4175164.1 methyl-accepting chemotaxis protein [Sulfitobacter noctilucicola]
MFDTPVAQHDNAMFHTMLEGMIDAVVIIGAASDIQFFNAAAERLWGYRREDVVGQNVRILLPRDLRTDRDSWLNAAQSGGPALREVQIERKDGSTGWAEIGLSAFSNDQRPTNYLAVLRDASQQRGNREVLAGLRSESADAIVEVSDNDLVTGFNTAAEHLWGFRRAEVIGQHVTMLVPARKYGDFDGFIDRAGKGGAARTKVNRQVPVVRKDGTLGHARLSVRFSDAEGRAGKYAAVLTDVSGQQAMTEETLELIRELLNQIGQMTNSINTIAQQTNLLSVNASIEAARAGDMGRGFGVVAMEIRALSNQARQITQEIEGVVEAGHQSVAELALRRDDDGTYKKDISE